MHNYYMQYVDQQPKTKMSTEDQTVKSQNMHNYYMYYVDQQPKTKLSTEDQTVFFFFSVKEDQTVKSQNMHNYYMQYVDQQPKTKLSKARICTRVPYFFFFLSDILYYQVKNFSAQIDASMTSNFVLTPGIQQIQLFGVLLVLLLFGRSAR